MVEAWDNFINFFEQYGEWITVLVIIVVGYPLIKIIRRLLHRALGRLGFDETITSFVERVVNVFLWLILLSLVLDNLGVNIAGFVAAIGIVGLAIAFAAQDSLANIIAGLFIMMDKPFKIGDRILLPTKIGSLYGNWGDVKEIGLRTTRVRSTDGVILTIPNRLITDSPLVNFSHMESPALRVRIRVGLVLDWRNVEKAEAVIDRLARDHPKVIQKPKPPEVVVREIRDSDVVMELRFYVANPSHMRPVKSDIIKSILREFEAQGVSLAYPVSVELESRVDLEKLGLGGL